VSALHELDRDDILVVVGGVIPAQDYAYLYEQGAVAVFGPGTVIPRVAKQLMDVLLTS
jgi:methylmalonyl-CoA mutase